MKSFKIVAAQGEITIRRIGAAPNSVVVPKGYTAMKPENGKFILGHSETGHHHCIDAPGAAVAVLDKAPEGMRILRMILADPHSLDHQRDSDTHESIKIEPGLYEVRIGREYDPYEEIARRQAD